MAINLKETIITDCKDYEKRSNESRLLSDCLYLKECKNSAESGMYQLVFNGGLLWYGTLMEINAIVKSMLTRIEYRDFIGR